MADIRLNNGGSWDIGDCPGDPGYAAVFLASAAADYITDHTVYVDGGFLSTMGPVCYRRAKPRGILMVIVRQVRNHLAECK